MSNDLAFVRALAGVRPGLSANSLRSLIGSRWREPLPHEQGQVLCLRHSYAFVAQIDVDGNVGRAEFGTTWSDPPFAAGIEVVGLHQGMSPADAKRVYPQLDIRPGVHPMPTFGLLRFDDHANLRLQFLFDKLRVIEIFDTKALYQPKLSTPYPAAANPPGHPFVDPNFKLVVMSDLIDRNIITLGTTAELASFVLKRPFDREQEGYSLNRPVYDYLLRYPLGQDHLDKVETIDFGGGLSIYPHIWPFYDGETDDFSVQSIEGIALCRHVTTVCDLPIAGGDFLRAPLRELPKLARLMLTIGDYSNIEALLDLPALAECHLWGNRIFADVSTPGHPSRRVMDLLRSRGVRLRVQYISCDGLPKPAFQ
jgi:hypothetical protein